MNEHNLTMIGDMAIRNGIVARKPEWMNMDYWLEYEAPRIGKMYTKPEFGLYGIEYDIDKQRRHKQINNPVPDDGLGDDGECLSCHL